MKPATTMPTGPFRMAGRRTVATTASKSLAEPRSSSDASTTDRLNPRLRAAVRHGPEALQALVGAEPSDHRDGVVALLRIHDLHLSPLASVSGTVRWQHHPAVADLKWRLEGALMRRLRTLDASRNWNLPADAVQAVRTVAHIDRSPASTNGWPTTAESGAHPFHCARGRSGWWGWTTS